MDEIEALARARLAAFAAQGEIRRLRSWQPIASGLQEAPDKRALVDLSGNDYLGLSRHPALVDRAIAWTRKWGVGSGASRLVTGTNRDQLAVEARLAAFKRSEAALVFASGFQANVAILSALIELLGSDGKSVEIFADRLNHASLHVGLAAAGIRQKRYRHNDLDHLADLLRRRREAGSRALIVSESVFSMDGDRADLGALVELAERHGAALYIDEAHATGILGPEGRGLAAAYAGRIACVMGTLGKAMGAAGAYVAGSRALVDYLVNRATGFVYSTAPMPALFGALDAALDLMPKMETERRHVAMLAATLRDGLRARGFPTGGDTQIVPAILGASAAASAAQARLEELGFLAIAIRPPTVPRSTARLRFSLSAKLRAEDIAALLAALDELRDCPPAA